MKFQSKSTKLQSGDRVIAYLERRTISFHRDTGVDSDNRMFFTDGDDKAMYSIDLPPPGFGSVRSIIEIIADTHDLDFELERNSKDPDPITVFRFKERSPEEEVKK